MMGGLSIYCDSVIFAIMTAEGRIMVKAREVLAEELEAEGSRIFEYTQKSGKTVSMCYWDLPEAAIDDPEIAVDWARRSLQNSAEIDGA